MGLTESLEHCTTLSKEGGTLSRLGKLFLQNIGTKTGPAQANEDEKLCSSATCASSDALEKVVSGLEDVAGESKLASRNV